MNKEALPILLLKKLFAIKLVKDHQKIIADNGYV